MFMRGIPFNHLRAVNQKSRDNPIRIGQTPAHTQLKFIIERGPNRGNATN